MTLPTFQNANVFCGCPHTQYAKYYVDANIFNIFMLSFKIYFSFIPTLSFHQPRSLIEVSQMLRRKKRGRPDTTMEMVEIPTTYRNNHPSEWVCIFQITVL